jgi:hypothetical protein
LLAAAETTDEEGAEVLKFSEPARPILDFGTKPILEFPQLVKRVAATTTEVREANRKIIRKGLRDGKKGGAQFREFAKAENPYPNIGTTAN